MGPSGGISSTSQRNNGPEQSSRHHLLQMLWAHPAAPLTSYQQQLNTMGPFEGVGSISAGTAHIINMGQIDTIGRISLDFEVGPLVVPIHFYSMGPCGLFQLQWSNCTWVVPTTTTKVFDIMCTTSPISRAMASALGAPSSTYSGAFLSTSCNPWAGGRVMPSSSTCANTPKS